MAKDKQLITPADQDAEILFKIQMKVADLVLGYWKQGLAVIGVVLLVILIIGEVLDSQKERQQEIAAEIARVEIPMVTPATDLKDPDIIAKITEAAKSLETIAKDSSGAGEIEAWVKAAELWATIQNNEAAINAYSKAFECDGGGILTFTAGHRLMKIYRDDGKFEEAKKINREMATSLEGFLAEQALLDLIEIEIESGNNSNVQKLAAEFKARFVNSPRVDKLAELELRAAKGS